MGHGHLVSLSLKNDDTKKCLIFLFQLSRSKIALWLKVNKPFRNLIFFLPHEINTSSVKWSLKPSECWLVYVFPFVLHVEEHKLSNNVPLVMESFLPLYRVLGIVFLNQTGSKFNLFQSVNLFSIYVPVPEILFFHCFLRQNVAILY